MDILHWFRRRNDYARNSLDELTKAQQAELEVRMKDVIRDIKLSTPKEPMKHTVTAYLYHPRGGKGWAVAINKSMIDDNMIVGSKSVTVTEGIFE